MINLVLVIFEMLCSCYADVLFKKEGKGYYLRNSNNKIYLSRLIFNLFAIFNFPDIIEEFLKNK